MPIRRVTAQTLSPSHPGDASGSPGPLRSPGLPSVFDAAKTVEALATQGTPGQNQSVDGSSHTGHTPILNPKPNLTLKS